MECKQEVSVLISNEELEKRIRQLPKKYLHIMQVRIYC